MKFIPHILYEDNHLLILEKPAGLLSQGDHTGDPNLVDLVKEYLKVKYQKPGNVYVGLVHRLDRPVSGIIILTKTSKASSRLQEQMKAGEIEKYYLAVTESHPPKEDDTLTHYLTKDEGKNKTKVYDHAKSDTK
ncbi:MAG: RNA pseudouridine synthase, partial [Saprospiraceae bacterium]